MSYEPLCHPFRLNDSVSESQEFGLGDRVVFGLDFGTLPFDCRGTVVGVSKKFPRVEVVFVDPVFSGTDLDGRCSKQRGAILSTSSLLNASNRQLPMKKSSEPVASGSTNLASLLSSSSSFPASMLPLQGSPWCQQSGICSTIAAARWK